MKTKAHAWIENGVIRCCIQMCEVGGVPCPRVEKCEAVEVIVGPDRRAETLEKLAETVRLYRIANYVAKDHLEKEIDSLLRELGKGDGD